MSVLPDVNVSITDGALGLLPPNTDNVHVALGVSSRGEAGRLYSFSDVRTLVDALGSGPLVEAVGYALSVKGGPVLAMPVASTVAGTTSSVTKSRSSSPGLSVSGSVGDRYDVQVVITRAGGLGAAAYKVSLDMGTTWGGELNVPVSGSAPLADTALTITFESGAYAAGDTFSFHTTAPGFGASDLTDALETLRGLPNEFGFVHVVCEPASAADAVALAVAADAKMTAFQGVHRYTFAIIEAPWDGSTVTDSVLAAAFGSFASTRVAVVAGHAQIVSAVTGRMPARHAGTVIAARAAEVPVHEDLGRFVRGPLTGVLRIDRDEQKFQTLDQQRFCTLRTIIGQAGYYVTNGRLMAGSASDYKLFQFRRVMDKASKVARDAALVFLNESVRVNANGTILEKDALVIEQVIQSRLASVLVAAGSATSVGVSVSRTNNVTSTQTLLITIRITALGYAKTISLDLGFTNPALA